MEAMDMLDDLKELMYLYDSGDMCRIDLEAKIHKYQSRVDQFDREMSEQEELFKKVALFG